MRAKRSALAFGTNLLFTGVTVLVALVTTPYLLGWLGDARFGAVRAVVDWQGYLILLELGVGGALYPMLARGLGRNDDGEVRRTLGVGVHAYVRVVLMVLAVGAVMTIVMPWFVPVDPDLVGDLRLGFAVGLAGMLALPLAPFRILQEARQRGYVVNLALLLQSLLTTGLALWLAWAGWGITGQLAAIATGATAFGLAMAALGVGRYRGVIRTGLFASPDPEAASRLRHLSGPTLVTNICGRASFMTDNIVVAAFLGPAVVAPFYLTQRLLVLIQGQLQGIGNSSWAALAEIHSRGLRDLFNERLVELTRLVTILGVAVLVPFAAFGEAFVRWWVGGEYFAGDVVLILTAANALMLGIVSLWGWCFSGTGHIERMLVPTVVATVINVAVSIALVQPLGMVGPLLGTAAGFLSTTMWYLPVLLRRLFGTSPTALAVAVLAPTGLGVPFAWATWWAAHQRPDWGLLTMGAAIAVATVAYLAIGWATLLGRDERQRYAGRVRSLLGRSG